MSEFRVLVTGARGITADEAAMVRQALARICQPALLSEDPHVIIVQGEADGVDRAAREWAEATRGVTSEGHPADWDRHGKAAGPIRNGVMVDLGADICVAFPSPSSRGTWDCLKRAADAGIPGRVYPLPGLKVPHADPMS